MHYPRFTAAAALLAAAGFVGCSVKEQPKATDTTAAPAVTAAAADVGGRRRGTYLTVLAVTKSEV